MRAWTDWHIVAQSIHYAVKLNKSSSKRKKRKERKKKKKKKKKRWISKILDFTKTSWTATKVTLSMSDQGNQHNNGPTKTITPLLSAWHCGPNIGLQCSIIKREVQLYPVQYVKIHKNVWHFFLGERTTQTHHSHEKRVFVHSTCSCTRRGPTERQNIKIHKNVWHFFGKKEHKRIIPTKKYKVFDIMYTVLVPREVQL